MLIQLPIPSPVCFVNTADSLNKLFIERMLEEDQASFNSFSVIFIAAFETALRPLKTVMKSDPGNFAIVRKFSRTIQHEFKEIIQATQLD